MDTREDLRDQSLARGIEIANIRNIRTLMEIMQLTVQQAMDALKIAKEDQPRYAAQL